MRLNQQFNVDDVPPDEFDLLPPGEYEAQVVESEITETSSGSGEMLKLTFEVTTGDFERRRVWERLNIVNANSTAQRIAQQSLAKLCSACGLAGIDDSDELHFIPILIKVDIRPGKGEFRDQNVIKGYREIPSRQPSQRSAPARDLPRQDRQEQPQRQERQERQQSQPPQRQAAGGRRPWDK